MTDREKMFGELPEGTFLYCLHCERAYPKEKYRVLSDSVVGLLQMCPYEDCDGDAVLDSWLWDRVAEENDKYPEVPVEGVPYPLHG